MSGNRAAHLKSYDNEPVTTEITQEAAGKHGKYLKGIKELSSKQATRLAAQLKYLHTSIYNLGNKMEELYVTVLLENHGVAALTEA